MNKPLLEQFPPLNIVELEIPDECIHEFDTDDLPNGWNSVPVSVCTQEFLSSWLEPGYKLAFSIPSAVNSFERNILINPLHTDLHKVVIHRFIPFGIDKRLYSLVLEDY